MTPLTSLFEGPLKPMKPESGLKAGLYIARGPRALTPWAMRSFEGVDESLGRQIYWVEGGSSSRVREEAGPFPGRVRLARVRDAAHLEKIVWESLPRLHWGRPIVLSDPLEPLFRPDLSEAQARSALNRILTGLRDLPTAVIVLLVDRDAPEGRQDFRAKILAEAKREARLELFSDGSFALKAAPEMSRVARA